MAPFRFMNSCSSRYMHQDLGITVAAVASLVKPEILLPHPKPRPCLPVVWRGRYNRCWPVCRKHNCWRWAREVASWRLESCRNSPHCTVHLTVIPFWNSVRISNSARARRFNSTLKLYPGWTTCRITLPGLCWPMSYSMPCRCIAWCGIRGNCTNVMWPGRWIVLFGSLDRYVMHACKNGLKPFWHTWANCRMAMSPR